MSKAYPLLTLLWAVCVSLFLLSCGESSALPDAASMSCGDGNLDPAEACDDGNAEDGDGCSRQCQLESFCGNGLIEAGEVCDDGNAVSGDGCRSDCQGVEVCGDDLTDAGEGCDDGNLIDGDGCDANCSITSCGNGVVTADEDCDDGNAIDGDGCDADCSITEEGPLEPIVYAKASNTGTGDQFGFAVALAGDTLVVGAPTEDSDATGIDGAQDNDSAQNSGAVYVFRRSGTTWAQEAYIKASNSGADDRFGQVVAITGDTLAVGALGEDSAAMGVDSAGDNEERLNSGAVYVFHRTGTTWIQEGYIKASNPGSNDQFGVSVALSGDTLAVGAFNEDSSAAGVNGVQSNEDTLNSGAVYVFRRSGTTWAQEAYIKASNPGVADSFGWSVALSGDMLAVGATGEDSSATGIDGAQTNDDTPASGAVYVIRRTGTSWLQDAYFKASNAGFDDQFGWSVALAGDVLAVGAINEDSSAVGVGGAQDDQSAGNSGAAFVFRRVGAIWVQEAYVKASNSGANDQFGRSIALADDVLAVGAINEDSDATGLGGTQGAGAINSGAAYSFHRTNSIWTQEAYVKASNTGIGDSFGGTSIAVSNGSLAVGAVLEDSDAIGINGAQGGGADNSGAVYIYQ